ncbi:antitoxin Xre/MbcA/ParS toxin-binding domain-containing protein [Aestuariivirga sp.]|uniref:type II RES/Xre toxin-antitoxin system antitoxin n=1 Tax=Aestuariivirga sp. TaxID=2650926 RepID=UPI0039E67540
MKSDIKLPVAPEQEYAGFAEQSAQPLDAVERLDGILQDALQHALNGAPVEMKPAQFKVLQQFYSVAELNDLIIPKRTLARRTAGKKNLTVDESDKALRVARITVEAERVFGNPEKSGRWLRRPTTALAGRAPIELLKTETGAKAVEELLAQIDHGIFA